MSLTIQKLSARFHAARRASERVCRLIPTLRGDLAAAFSYQLAPRWPSRAGICLIRRLPVRIRVTAEELEAGRLPFVFAAAFAEALAPLLEHPGAPRPAEMVHFESQSAYLAQFVMDLLSGIAAARWEYEELRELRSCDPVDAIVSLFEREPGQFLLVLCELETNSALEPFLARLGEYGLERLLIVTARTPAGVVHELSLADLASVAKAVLLLPSSYLRFPLATRAQAFRVFVRRAAELQQADERLSPWQVFDCLKALELVLKHLAGLAPQDWHRPLEDLLREGKSDVGASRVSALLSQMKNHAECSAGRNLRELLEQLAQKTSASSVEHTERLFSSRCAGLFFLVRLLRRDGWPAVVGETSAGGESGARAVQLLLATLSLEALGHDLRVAGELDPGVALFSGCFGALDLAALREFQSERASVLSAELSARLKRDSGSADDLPGPGESPVASLGHRYLQRIREEVPGLRQASREFLVKNTLALPGRICVTPDLLTIELPPAPFHVALHIAGMDQAVEEVPWLGGRGIRFRLEGL